MPIVLFRVLFFSIVIIAAIGSANGQEANSSTEPSGRVIEIQSSRSPKPFVIALSREHRSGFWASGFARLKDWKLPSTGDPIQALDFSARLVGNQGELIISLFSGKRFGDITENVARILLSEGDTIVVSEMKKFGFEPVTVKMFRVPTAIADVPLVSNPAPLLRTTVTNVVSTLPTFNIKFVNESSKAIMAFAWYTEAGGKGLSTALAQPKYGRPLIEANGSYEMNINAENPNPAANYITMVIGAVIYEDGSVEGDVRQAAMFLSFTEGRKKALDQLVPIFRKAAETHSQRSNLPALIASVDALTDGGPQAKGIPSSAAGIAFAGVIRETLGFLRRLDSESVGKSDLEVDRSLVELANFYRDWQIRMQK